MSDRPEAGTPSGIGQADPLSILLVEDNRSVVRAIDIALRMAGHRITVVSDPPEAFAHLAAARYDAVLLDMNFTPGRSGGEEGLACLARIMADDPAACVVVITAHSGIRIAVAAMQAGASDFVTKPWRNADLVAKVEAAVRRSVARGAPRETGDGAPRMVGESAAMQRLRDLIRRVGPTPASVAVSGPPGSGRTLAASAIHRAGSGAGPPPDRIDVRDEGAWSRLDGGATAVILRHPDQLDAIAQARLVDRLPGRLRCIAVVDTVATLIPALRHRIATVEVAVPPLCDRSGDAILLARHFARAAAERFGRPAVRLTGAAEAAVAARRWPDEVRGLALAIERAVLLVDRDLIDAPALALPDPREEPAEVPSIGANFDLEGAERTMIAAALREHRHNVTHAAAALGLSRGALYRRMTRHGL